MANTKQEKIALYTLGCKLNYAETSTLFRQFQQKGFERVDISEPADVVVINTCSVTNQADKKCRQIIKKAQKLNPDAYITVVGCYAQLQPEKISNISGVDLVIGTQDKFKVAELVGDHRKTGHGQIHSCAINEVRNYNASYSLADRTRSFLKVQDGCDYFCSFCTIPYARGKSRNSSVADVINNAYEIANAGVKEIVLTGVNIGDFGRSTNENLYQLLVELQKVEGIERIRISSIEPNLLTNEILHLVHESEKLMPHFHIPLQSGNNKILSLMKRKYRRELYQDRVRYIKNLMPDAFIGCDVIVGFPGENTDDFNDTYQFIENMPVTELHVFSYSDRKDALANKIKQKVSPVEKSRRSNLLQELSAKKKKAFYKQALNQSANVLFEKQHAGGMMFGFTENYIKTTYAYQPDLVEKIVPVQLKSLTEKGEVEVALQNVKMYELS